MINLTSEEWGLLQSMDAFRKLIENLQRERQTYMDMMADGEFIDQENGTRTVALNAGAVGRIQVLAEIINYKPVEEDEADDRII